LGSANSAISNLLARPPIVKKDAPSARSQTGTRVSGAVLVNALTLEGWYLLLVKAVAISRTTGICALLFSRSSRHKGTGGEFSVARIERFNIQRQKRCEEYRDDGK